MQKSNVLNIADIHFYKKKKKSLPFPYICQNNWPCMNAQSMSIQCILNLKKIILFMSIKIMINELQRPCCNEIIKVVSPASTVLTPGVY